MATKELRMYTLSSLMAAWLVVLQSLVGASALGVLCRTKLHRFQPILFLSSLYVYEYYFRLLSYSTCKLMVVLRNRLIKTGRIRKYLAILKTIKPVWKTFIFDLYSISVDLLFFIIQNCLRCLRASRGNVVRPCWIYFHKYNVTE